LFDYNKILSVCLQYLSVCLSDWYVFKNTLKKLPIAYRLSPVSS